MIGNDVIDLALARCESNWKRKGFLNKLFNSNEQRLIFVAANPEIRIWNLWSRKEAAYKIFNRETGVRAFNPLKFECTFLSDTLGTVTISDRTYHTLTTVDFDSIHTLAVANESDFVRISFLKDDRLVRKENGIPRIENKPISISGHGRFRKIVALN